MGLALWNSAGTLINRVCGFFMLRGHRRNSCQLKLLLYSKSGKKISPWHASGTENIIFTITLLYHSVACKRDEGKVFCCCHCTGPPSLSGPNRRESVKIGERRSKGVYPIQWWSSKCTPAQPMDVFVYVYLFIFLHFIYLCVFLYAYETSVLPFPLTLPLHNCII